MSRYGSQYNKYYYCSREKKGERWILHEDAVKKEHGVLCCPKCNYPLRLGPRNKKGQKKPYVIEIPPHGISKTNSVAYMHRTRYKHV